MLIEGGSGRVEHESDGADGPLPVLACLRQMADALWRQAIELRPSAFGRDTPRRGDQLLILEAVQRRIERTLVDLQRFARQLPEAVRNAPPVERFGLQRLEHLQVERARQ